MDLQKIKELVKNFKGPTWLKWSLVLLAAIMFAVHLLTSCGATRASVVNRATGTTTEVRITTNNPTSVKLSPNVKIDSSFTFKNK